MISIRWRWPCAMVFLMLSIFAIPRPMRMLSLGGRRILNGWVRKVERWAWNGLAPKNPGKAISSGAQLTRKPLLVLNQKGPSPRAQQKKNPQRQNLNRERNNL